MGAGSFNDGGMLTAILITIVIVAALAYAAQSGSGGLIARRPYNNPHNDATGARQDHLG
jgi:hypothetical protein